MRKNVGSGWTEYFYGPNGSVQSEYNGTWPFQYVYAGNDLIAQYTSSTTEFVHKDHLGSTRLVTGVNQGIVDSMDYLPFGLQIAGGTTTTHKFTGKERDNESGIDNFGARYYESYIGRFMTPDWAARPTAVPYAVSGDPQSLNLYGYVRNDPLSRADADGHCFWCHLGGVDGPPSSVIPAWLSFLYGGGSVPTQAAQNTPQQQTQQTQQQDQTQQPTSGHLNINWDAVLKKTSDFSAGAGDCLTGSCIPFVHGSLTQLARGDADSVVDKKSLAYKGGEVTGGAVGSALLSAGGATLAALADGKNGALFGRGLNTVFNSSKVRFGWGWQGSATAGQDVIRLGIGAARGTSWWSHIVFWVP